jgi:predicted nucleic acid-binding protein
MRAGERVFVDTGAWIALALSRDPLHEAAKSGWETLLATGTRLFTSVAVVLETFTFLDRAAAREVAVAWKLSLDELEGLRILGCAPELLERAWPFLTRKDLHKLSAVDATSFALMREQKIHLAFAFDHHFAAVGFRLVG